MSSRARSQLRCKWLNGLLCQKVSPHLRPHACLLNGLYIKIIPSIALRLLPVPLFCVCVCVCVCVSECVLGWKEGGRWGRSWKWPSLPRSQHPENIWSRYGTRSYRYKIRFFFLHIGIHRVKLLFPRNVSPSPISSLLPLLLEVCLELLLF